MSSGGLRPLKLRGRLRFAGRKPSRSGTSIASPAIEMLARRRKGSPTLLPLPLAGRCATPEPTPGGKATNADDVLARSTRIEARSIVCVLETPFLGEVVSATGVAHAQLMNGWISGGGRR